MSVNLLTPFARMTVSPSPSSVSVRSGHSRSPSPSVDPPAKDASPAAPKDKYQLVFMGAGCVGKTSLISRFLFDALPKGYKPTVEDMYTTELRVGNEVITWELLDTSGTMQFPAMQALNISRGDGFVLVYSVTDQESFEEVKRLREQIVSLRKQEPAKSQPNQVSRPAPPIVVVGNKVDLLPRHSLAPTLSQHVPRVTAETIATIDWEHGFVETSARTGENVNEIFKELVKQCKLGNLGVAELEAALCEKRRKSFPLCFGAPKRKEFRKKRGSCSIN